jgi:TM2 domain-containing membrane protein YozV
MAEENVAIGANEVYCRSCGGIIKSEAEICPKCGVRQKAPVSEKSEKSFAVLVLLSFFFGWLGADRFYAGQIGMGVFKLIGCSGLYIISFVLMFVFVGFLIIWIPTIWWLIDFIIVLCGKMKDSNGKYIK